MSVPLRASRPADLPGWHAAASRSSFYTSPAWLDFVDSAQDAEPRYLMSADAAGAALVAHWSPDEGHPAYRAQDVLPGPAALTSAPRLTLGGRRGFCSGVVGGAGADPAALRGLVAAALDLAPGASGRWWWPYLPSADADLVFDAARGLDPAAGNGVHLVNADCVIDVRGDSVRDHVEGLPAKQRRTNARREQQRFADSGLTVTRMGLAEVVDAGAPLLGQVQRKYGQTFTDDYLRGFLGRQAELLGEHAVVFAAHDGPRLVAFSLCYAWGDELALRLTGMDYAALKDADEYAQLAVYAPLAHCYEQGLRTLHLGTGSYEAKCRRGATVRPLWAVAPDVPAYPAATAGRAAELAAGMPQREAAALLGEVASRTEAWAAAR